MFSFSQNHLEKTAFPACLYALVAEVHVHSPTGQDYQNRDSSFCRPLKKCPVSGCPVKVIHLPRHLREQHGWKREDARSATAAFNLRKRYQHRNATKPTKFRDYHKARRCPVENCSAVITRMSSHLQSCHRIPKISELYKEMLAKARQASKFDKHDHVLHNLSASDHEDETLPSSETVMENSQTVDTEPPQTVSVNTSNIDHECTSILENFHSWLKSPDGGTKDGKSAKQHLSQIICILRDTEQNELCALWDKAVLDRFRCRMDEKKFLPATKKSYLNSVRHLYRFLTCEGLCTNEQAKNIGQMKDRLACWISSYRKESAKHVQKKLADDLNKLVTPEDIEKFKSSEVALSAIKIIGSYADGLQAITQSDFVVVRDYLMTSIALANANRSGVLATVTLQQFEEARLVDDHYVVSVCEHKTAASYGPAKLVLTPMLHSWVRIYARHIRPNVVTRSNAKEMFLSCSGDSMSSGQITRAVQSIWLKAGLNSNVTFNLFRKTAVTKMHSIHPNMNAQLADLMCHRVQTAQKCYRVTERERTSVAAAKQLAIAMMPVSTSVAAALSSDEQLHQSSGTSQSSQAVSTPVEQNSVAEQPDYPEQLRIVWNEEQKSELARVFESDFSASHITMASVREKIRHNSVLSVIGERKVYDRLRSELRNKHPSSQDVVEFDTGTDLCDIDTHTDIVGPSVASRANDIFSDDDVQVIKQFCSQVIARGPISDDRIHDVLNKSSKGSNLLEKFSLFQLKNRIKYERRKLFTKY